MDCDAISTAGSRVVRRVVAKLTHSRFSELPTKFLDPRRSRGIDGSVNRMSIAGVLAIVAGSAILASGAELHGTWSASSNSGQRLAGAWTAEAHQESGGAIGTWALYDAAGKIFMQGGWSASKSPKAWDGAWRATTAGRAGEYSGTWTAQTPLTTEAPLAQMLESALRAVVTGTWKAGANSGSWSIRAFP